MVDETFKRTARQAAPSAPDADLDSTLVSDPERAGPEKDSLGELTVGTTIKDRFVIDGVIGRGGMGVVYRARDLRKEEAEDRDPYVALKVLSDRFRLDTTMIISLQRESRKAQTLAHPSIATVYDFDRDRDTVYLTMELLEGQPLDELIENHPEGMPEAEVLPLLRGLCLGLAYAHNKNIIHSDFKPGNVFLTSEGRVKILDFGIARAAPVAEAGASDVTVFDAASLGALTPSYAALEMWHGVDPHPSDDVYALAIVAYELLTGKHPFGGATALQAQAQGLKPAPIRQVKSRTWHAVQHGLALDREHRTAHAAEFLKELEGPPKLRLVLGATAIALVGTLGFAGFQEYQSVRARLPDIPFEELASDRREAFTTLMDEGRILHQFGDLSSALDRYFEAYRVHPRNPQAVEGMTTLIDELVDITESQQLVDDAPTLRANIEALMAEDDFLARNDSLVRANETLQRLR
ncbi:MAG: serine/threonine-protein kinase [Pseudomonadales bacterium]